MGSDSNEHILLKRVDRLEAGMVVARDIHSRDGCRLLSAGDELTYDDIDRLKRWSKRSIHIHDPEAESKDENQDEPNYREAS